MSGAFVLPDAAVQEMRKVCARLRADEPLIGAREILSERFYLALQQTNPASSECLASHIESSAVIDPTEHHALDPDARFWALSSEQCSQLVRQSTRLDSSPLSRAMRDTFVAEVEAALSRAAPITREQADQLVDALRAEIAAARSPLRQR